MEKGLALIRVISPKYNWGWLIKMWLQMIPKNMQVCTICSNEIELNSNLDGLVIDDRDFICTDCCKNTDKAILRAHILEKSRDHNNLKPVMVRPIMRWLWSKH